MYQVPAYRSQIQVEELSVATLIAKLFDKLARRPDPGKTMIRAYEITLNGECMGQVFHVKGMTSGQFKDKMVNEYGMDPKIKVTVIAEAGRTAPARIV